MSINEIDSINRLLIINIFASERVVKFEESVMSKFNFLTFKFLSREEIICAKLLSGLIDKNPLVSVLEFFCWHKQVVIETSFYMNSRTNKS